MVHFDNILLRKFVDISCPGTTIIIGFMATDKEATGFASVYLYNVTSQSEDTLTPCFHAPNQKKVFFIKRKLSDVLRCTQAMKINYSHLQLVHAPHEGSKDRILCSGKTQLTGAIYTGEGGNCFYVTGSGHFAKG